MTHEEVSNKYIEDVLATPSPYVTCEWTKKACLRQRADLLRQGQEDFPYVWDPDAGSTVVDFIACLKHLKGEFAGKPFILSPWQVFMVMCAFSWKRKDNIKLRRYRRVILQAGKSSGKTMLSAALCLYMLAADNEGGAEIVTAARATSQARLTFDTARDCLRAAPELCEAFGLRVLTHSITQPSTASVMLPVSSQAKSAAGKIIHYGSIDECWSHMSRDLYEEISLGADKRNNSMVVSLGHCGESLLSVGYELYVSATKILNGELPDDRTFALIYDASDYDPKTKDAILAANPNAGISSYLNTLLEAQTRAIAIPSLWAAFASHILCMWTDGTEAKQWLSKELVESCMTDKTEMSVMKSWFVGEHEAIIAPDQLRPFVVGVERSSLQEKACVVYCCKSYLNNEEHFYLFPRYFDPESNDDEQLADAILADTRGHTTYSVIQNPDGYALKSLAHDSWFPPSPRVEKNGITVIPFAKTARTFSPVLDWAMSLILAGRLHFNDETLAAHLLGIHAKRDLNSNIFPRRAHPDKSIDAALAAFYALRLAMVPSMLATPANDGVGVTFIMDSGEVRQMDKNGTMVTVSPAYAETDKSGHPSDRQ